MKIMIMYRVQAEDSTKRSGSRRVGWTEVFLELVIRDGVLDSSLEA
jgi:hypothetical protein